MEGTVKPGPCFLAVLLGLTLLSGCASPCRHFSFHEVSPGVFVGCRPKRQADFDAIRKHDVRTIISLETCAWHTGPERQKAKRNGMAFRNAPIFASPLPPNTQAVKNALLLLSDQSLRPVYLHCFWGRDRALFIIGLYQIYYEGSSPEDAWKRMLARGYKHDWSLAGFAAYFWRHARKPDWAIPEVARAQRQ